MFSDMSESLSRLYDAIAAERPAAALNAFDTDRDVLARQSADLLRCLTMLWSAAGIDPQDVWNELKLRS